MILKFDKIDDKLIVFLNGELDHHSAEEVRVKIDDRIDRDNIKKVIMDFNNVTFMDSSGIGVVIGRFKKVQNRDGVVCVVNVNSRVDRVFTLSGLYKIIKSYINVEEAVKCI
ncbi:MAG: anti-sigma F factor antagonist [Clostridium sp.]|uniref:anti-sigma F factor antagonist n=1 Tax=Clostridium sp. TaxID=1506 RepID=UPI0025C297B9|nr:anti-sigma F factor antagonist [Clostridium sp.]MCF0149697.1 anti-sigma F factor antagonist [Clostridium sp.]